MGMFGIEGMPGMGDMDGLVGIFCIGIFMPCIMSAQQSFDWAVGETAFIMG
jgi:hypothetical protein